MFKRVITLGLASAAFLVFAGTAIAEEQNESPLELTLSTDVVSDYVFRGTNVFEGTAFQPFAGLTYALSEEDAIGGSIWGHIPGESGHRNGTKFVETDYTLSYEHSFGPFSVGAGHVWYLYPDDGDEDLEETAEFFGSIGLDTFLSPRFAIYEDYDAFDMQYYELSLSQRLGGEEAGELNLTPYVNFGFASNAEKAYDENGLVQVTTGVATDLKAGDLVITPSFHQTFKIDDATVNEFWFKVGIAYSL